MGRGGARKGTGPKGRFVVRRSLNLDHDTAYAVDQVATEFNCGPQDVVRGCIKKALQEISRKDVSEATFKKPV